ncbi:hypothetical protein OHA72_18315 [Dactylosporangium sp. NBC_01737]|uniref:hypothetical protein n=1 Tax=Dactylosporangium sp. NBC_01737 TaxID=2975959 RepID=UPI002E0F0448|nr:hypothetical protein OHA72_18315 [Dactylosporangium sp. NBC_01737]
MTTPTREGRFEGLVQVVILIGVAGMAGAASFTHVHDWTMHNSPDGTGDWFGWANAMVSELIPLAAALEIRRRRRNGMPVGRYPVALILAAVALSLAGQFAEAKPGVSGWLISAVPALGFLALVKLVLSSPTTPAAPVTTVDEDHAEEPAPVYDVPAVLTPAVDTWQPTSAAVEPAHLETAAVPAHLLPATRFVAVNHQQTTGQHITADELATRMNVAPDLARQLLNAIDEPTPARHNGATVTTTATR